MTNLLPDEFDDYTSDASMNMYYNYHEDTFKCWGPKHLNMSSFETVNCWSMSSFETANCWSMSRNTVGPCQHHGIQSVRFIQASLSGCDQAGLELADTYIASKGLAHLPHSLPATPGRLGIPPLAVSL